MKALRWIVAWLVYFRFWLTTQSRWYVDAYNGNDLADGDKRHPLRTFREASKRIGPRLRVRTTVFIMSDMPADDPICVDVTASRFAELAFEASGGIDMRFKGRR